MQSSLLLIKTLSGLHCGTGEGSHDIDLPTARDPLTGFPQAPGSSIRGIFRDHFFAKADDGKIGKKLVTGIFGDAPSEISENSAASCVSFGDARLLCLPVRTQHRTFAYLTSPIALHFFMSDLKRVGFNEESPPLPTLSVDVIAINDDSMKENSDIFLEDYSLRVDNQYTVCAGKWAKIIQTHFASVTDFCKELFSPRFAIVNDDLFQFLCETALPVVTRNQIGTNGVAQDKMIWTEEFIPCEALLYSLVHFEPNRRDTSVPETMVRQTLLEHAPKITQLGGKASVGRGMISVAFAK